MKSGRQLLTDEEFMVTRKQATERPFTGRYHASKAPGLYRCVCCGADLFDAAAKFESGTGWPSFWAPANEENVATKEDHSYGNAPGGGALQCLRRPPGARFRRRAVAHILEILH